MSRPPEAAHDSLIAAGWVHANCPELPGDWWRHPSRGGGVAVYSTEQALRMLGDAPASDPTPRDVSLSEGDRVRVIDGSRHHGDCGAILRKLDDGLILVELDDNGACWPVVVGEIEVAP